MSTPDFHPIPLIGREGELAAVVETFTRSPSVCFVSGAPGHGKTRIVDVAAKTKALEELRPLSIRCYPLERRLPFAPVLDAISRTLRGIGKELTALCGALVPHLPEHVEALPPPLEPIEDAALNRSRLLRALAEAILATETGLLVVEDIHWADSSTLEWLHYVMELDCAPSLLATHRPLDPSTDPMLLKFVIRAHFGQSPRYVCVPALNDSEVLRMASAMLGGARKLGKTLQEQLLFTSRGSPLVLQELLYLLRDRGELQVCGDRVEYKPLSALPIPRTISESISERQYGMTLPGRRILAATAVHPSPARLETVIETAALADHESKAAVEEAIESGLVERIAKSGIAFRHAIDAVAVLESVSEKEKSHVHLHAAKALLRRERQPLDQIANHFLLGGDIPSWRTFMERYAVAANERGQAHEAMNAILSVEEGLLDGASTEAARLLLLAGKYALRGLPISPDVLSGLQERVRRLLCENRSLATGQRAHLHYTLGRLSLVAGRNALAVDHLRRGLLSHGECVPDALLAARLLAMPIAQNLDPAEHVHWFEHAERLAISHGLHQRPEHQLSQATSMLLRGEVQGWELLRTSLPMKHSDQTLEAASWLWNAMLASVPWGRLDETQSMVEAAERCSRPDVWVRFEEAASTIRRYLDWYRGQWGGLVVREDAGLARDPRGSQQEILFAGLAGLAAGNPDASDFIVSVFRSDAEWGSADPSLALVSAAFARMHLSRGDAEAAWGALEPVVSLIVRGELWLWSTDVLVTFCDVSAHLGQLDAARDLIVIIDERARGLGVPSLDAALATGTGVLFARAGQLPQALRSFDSALEYWSRAGRPYDLLLTRERRAEVLIGMGNVDRGVRELSSTAVALRDLGAFGDAERVARNAREAGRGEQVWRGGRRGYGDQLSPREREVAALVGEGMTNREIGERLHISPKTVGQHVSRAMRKTGSRNRTALAKSISSGR